MKIAITQKHYEDARACRYQDPSATCVLAQAVRDVVKEGTFITVGAGAIHLSPAPYEHAVIHHTPASAAIVRDFDAGRVVAPCEIKLPIPEQFIAVK